MAVAVAATGAREARGGRWGGLSVPKPPKGVAESGSVGRRPFPVPTPATEFGSGSGNPRSAGALLSAL
jgi:hypothetical protein